MTARYVKVFAICQCILMLGCTLTAQTNWSIQHYSTADGLPDRTVNTVLTDTFGFSWLATETGLVRFDGHRFDRPPFLESLLEDGEHIIREMKLGEDGQLITWTGGSDFLQLINSGTNEVARVTIAASPLQSRQKWLHFLLENGKPLAGLLLADDGQYIVVERKGDKRVLENTVTIPTNTTDVAKASLSRYLGNSASRGRIIFVAESKQLTGIGATSNRTYSLPAYKKTARLLYLDQQDRIWFQSDEYSQLHVLLPEKDNFEVFLPLFREDSIRYNKVYEDASGNLIFGTINPTYTQALVKLNLKNETESLSRFLRRENRVISITGKDFERAIEMGSHGGFYRFVRQFPRLESQLYLHDPLLPKSNKKFGYVIRGFAEGADGRVYGNTEGSRWFSFSREDYKMDTIFPEDEFGEVVTKIGSGHNLISQGPYIYGGYGRGGSNERRNYLTRLDTRTSGWERFEIPKKEAFIRFVLKLPDGELLVFTFRRSDRSTTIFRFVPETATFREVGEINAALPRRARTSVQNVLFDEARQLIWIAMGNGLFAMPYCASQSPCYFENQPIKRYREINAPIQSLIIDHKGKLLLGTYGEGVQCFDPEANTLTTVAFDARNANAGENTIDLPSNLIGELLLIDSNYLLITTFDGLVVANRTTRQSTLYGEDDGLPNKEFNRLAAFMDSRGSVFLGGINGLMRTPKSALLPKTTQLLPRISRYYAYDEASRTITNSYPEPQGKSLSITVEPGNLYFGLDFVTSAGEKTGYRTQLVGYDVGYSSINQTGNVEYLRVPAGNYELKVKAVTASGKESAVPLTIPIKVMQPWYLRPWFLVLSQLLLISGGVLIYRSRVKRVRREEAEKRRIGNQLAEMEMKILRQQLNPHFIFNALGAIQHFIQNMQGADAMEYLADFAKLMRMFLESSKQSYIFLVDELKLIKLYVRLEQLRFQQRFDVVYDIDPELDLEMEDIPSLLLQPFVENAINHGLFHLRRQGRLTIGMRLDEEDRIICTVADDGIGRTAAAELRKHTYKKHKSRATQIVAERLEIFQRDAESDLEIITEDLYPDREETGTKVTIIVDNGE